MAVRPKSVRFDRLHKVMGDLGYGSQRTWMNITLHFYGLVVTCLSSYAESHPKAEVRPIDLLSVQKTLMNEGLIESEQQFTDLFSIKKGDRLIWTDPRSGMETEVTAASGETSDGMVIIKQKGKAFSPCPVDQSRPVADASVHT